MTGTYKVVELVGTLSNEFRRGNSGYRVISLTIQPNAQVRVLPMQYPASEIYFFKPLNERIPVFQKPFRLIQELVLDGTPAGQEAMRGKRDLTLTGTLQYQACDERICYNPVSVPLSWKLSLRQVIRERPTGSALGRRLKKVGLQWPPGVPVSPWARRASFRDTIPQSCPTWFTGRMYALSA